MVRYVRLGNKTVRQTYQSCYATITSYAACAGNCHVAIVSKFEPAYGARKGARWSTTASPTRFSSLACIPPRYQKRSWKRGGRSHGAANTGLSGAFGCSSSKVLQYCILHYARGAIQSPAPAKKASSKNPCGDSNPSATSRIPHNATDGMRRHLLTENRQLKGRRVPNLLAIG